MNIYGKPRYVIVMESITGPSPGDGEFHVMPGDEPYTFGDLRVVRRQLQLLAEDGVDLSCIHVYELKEVEMSTLNSMSYDTEITKIAEKLCNGNKFLREELRSEMHVTLLSAPCGHNDGYYFKIMKEAAVDLLRRRGRTVSIKDIDDE